MRPDHPDWGAYCDEQERRQDARADAREANAEADPRDWSAEYRCACGAVADTTVYHDAEPVKRSCVPCAMSFASVLTEPLPRKTR